MKNFNTFHVFKQNDSLNMQEFFIFVDTETYISEKNEKEEIQKLKLGWAIFWNRILDIKEYKYFETTNDFWDFVEEKMQKCKEIIIYAHNTDFDMKILNGYEELFINRNFEIEYLYTEQRCFILNAKKGKNKIRIWDTFNYFPTSLKKIGEILNLHKGEIDFNKCSMKELSIYCKNDTEILFELIKNLIEYLEKYDLSKLKPTIASLSLNVFRHRFYDSFNNKINIHSWHKCIKLERNSYKGGICDCFKVGKYKIPLFKLDINSMYPYVMKKYKLPTKLIYYSNNLKDNLEEKLKNALKNNKLVILGCNIYLPEKYAYLLNKVKVNKESKSIFCHGNFDIVLNTPEIEYILKYGKINKIYEIGIYDSENIFKEYVDFFYSQRLEFKEQKNHLYQNFSKSLLTNLYGKFAQKEISYEITKSDEYKIDSYLLYNFNTKGIRVMQFGDKIISIKDKEKNAYDSFVAIASHITGYARIYLIELILKAERENTYYLDTDCLIVNKKGYENLKDFIDEKELGKLKLEGISNYSEFIRPKFYTFNNEIKRKGIKKDAKIINENENNITFSQNCFEKTKTSLRRKRLNEQHIYMIEKICNKKYDKGIVFNNIVYPFKLNNYG